MNEIKIQWHPGFVAAINLELAENRDDLIYEKEYNLNTKPLERSEERRVGKECL